MTSRSRAGRDRKSTRLNSSHVEISYAVFCLKKKKKTKIEEQVKTKTHNNDTNTAICESTLSPSCLTETCPCISFCRHFVHLFFFFNDTATTEIYTLSLHDALPI